MKMMDISTDDDCNIEGVTPPKKKKMKQARLPFQMLSSVDSPNSISNKKRKLTSPSVECKNPKVVKITTKENSIEEESSKNTELNDTLNESDNSTEVLDDVIPESEEVQEDKTLSATEETCGKKVTPKRSSTGKHKKVEKKTTMKPSALTKFLQKTEKDVEIKDDHEDSPTRDEKSLVIAQKSPSTKSENAALINSPTNRVKDIATPSGNDSACANSDSDIAILSSDNEEQDEQKNSSVNLDDSKNVASPVTSKTSKTERSTDAMKHRKLTPKQKERKLESAKRKQERERLRMEKEKKLEEERENRRREKEEKRKEKEEKEKAEKEQKMKEKKLKELKKQMEIEQKQKEKEAKEEERRKREEAKEEEKRKKEEEKLEAERKKQKAASNFASFFVPKKQETKPIEEESAVEVKTFMPFEVKADMKVAPVCRRVLNGQEKLALDEKCNEGNTKESNLYIKEIKDKLVIPRKAGRTWPFEAKDDVIILDEENDDTTNIVDQAVIVEKHRPKLFQFTENRRPPYWGTWRKRSRIINPRRPFTTDTKWFNYEVDSDDEWEEEEPGESLRGSDDEKDEENPEDNEYDVDNEFMVPHGYLSDEEARADGEDKEDMSPETQKFKLKVLGEQFESERNTKTSRLKPKIIGCVWQEIDNKFSENVPPKVVEFLSARQAWVRQIPVTLPGSSENENVAGGECGTPTQQHVTTSSKKTKVPKDALPDLIRLVHGNIHGRGFLVKEFMAYWNKKNKVGENQISKSSLFHKIREIGRWMACPEEGPMHLKACWYITEDTRKEYLPENEVLTLPNRWSYTLTPKRRSEVLDMVDKPDRDEKEKEKKHVPLITQFTKKITQEEMKKQLSIKPAASTSSKSSTQQRIPKRATLISVARGEQFSKTSRENLLKNFVSNDKTKDTNDKYNDDSSSDDIIFIKVLKGEQKDDRDNVVNKAEEDVRNDNRLVTISSTETKVETDDEEGSVSAKKMKLENETDCKDSDDNVTSNNEAKHSIDTSMDVDETESKKQ